MGYFIGSDHTHIDYHKSEADNPRNLNYTKTIKIDDVERTMEWITVHFKIGDGGTLIYDYCSKPDKYALRYFNTTWHGSSETLEAEVEPSEEPLFSGTTYQAGDKFSFILAYKPSSGASHTRTSLFDVNVIWDDMCNRDSMEAAWNTKWSYPKNLNQYMHGITNLVSSNLSSIDNAHECTVQMLVCNRD